MGFVTCEPTLKGLGMVSVLCNFSQPAKGQMCLGHIMLVSDPAGRGLSPLCWCSSSAVNYPRGCSGPELVTLLSPGQGRNCEGPSASDFLQVPLLVSSSVLWVGTETCPRATFPPTPVPPHSSFWVFLSLL